MDAVLPKAAMRRLRTCMWGYGPTSPAWRSPVPRPAPCGMPSILAWLRSRNWPKAAPRMSGGSMRPPLPPPAAPVQTALHRAPPCCAPLRRAAAARAARAGTAGPPTGEAEEGAGGRSVAYGSGWLQGREQRRAPPRPLALLLGQYRVVYLRRTKGDDHAIEHAGLQH